MGQNISTGSGSYTLGLENMCSGEAQTYLDTFENILEDMASLVVPENCTDKSIQKILFSFKGLMTDFSFSRKSKQPLQGIELQEKGRNHK